MKVFVILKNKDFTEGRGPMLFSNVKSTLEKAKAYVDEQKKGVCGAKPPEGMGLGEWCMSGKDGGWAGYEIKEIEME